MTTPVPPLVPEGPREHNHLGNCWDETKVYACRRCGKGNLCDVCHKHDVPRGSCFTCLACPAFSCCEPQP